MLTDTPSKLRRSKRGSDGCGDILCNGCSTVQKIVIEIMFEIVIEIMIEICMEQTRLFQFNRFHYADFRDWNRDWIFQFWKILIEIGKNQ